MEDGVHVWRRGRIGLAGPLSPESVPGLAGAGESSEWVCCEKTASDTRILLVGSCTTGFDVATAFVKEERLRPWDSVLAIEQTAGCGQRGRNWISPAGNLHAVWRLPASSFLEEKTAPLLPLMMGTAVAFSMMEMGLDVRVKWPNDLVLGERKVGGMLIRISGETILVGIGINLVVCPPDDVLRSDHVLPATHLDQEGFRMPLHRFWDRLVVAVRRRLLKMVEISSTSDLLSIFSHRLMWMGQDVRVTLPDRPPFRALVTGLAEDGGLCLEVDGEGFAVHTASIGPV